MMKKIAICYLFLIASLLGCSSSDHAGHLEENNTEPIHKSFKEGVIDMGIFSQDVDLGKLIGKIDFSQSNVKQQFEELLKSDRESKAIFDLIKNVGAQNPVAALAMTMNIAECTYYIKNDVVLGKARGLGWRMENFHSQGADEGSLYLETLSQAGQISTQDKKIYSRYKPSGNQGEGAVNEIDFNLFDRQLLSKKQNILGYECDVVVYTPKTTDPNDANLTKIVAYSSSLFQNTINFTHPYYLEEKGGILRLDIYLMDSHTPTLVMKPKSIKEQVVLHKDLICRTATPVYTEMSTSWAFKALAIMMSGWAALEDKT